jgi:hypothetical protein
MWATAACAVVVAGAAAAFEPDPAPKAAEMPQALATAADPKKDADLPEPIRKLPFEIRDGYRRYTKRCNTCHDNKHVDEVKAKKSLFDWQGTIGAMALKKGANIPLEDRQPIFLYLAYLHGTNNGDAQQKDEYVTFLNRCENCHGVGLIYKDKKALKDWPNIVHRMAGKNQAKISAEDEKKVVNYVNRMYPDVFGVE